MAVTAKFIADFDSFYDAVQKADVQLRGLETGSSKVETALNRMADSFSGRKIIQDANLTAEAIQRIGGVSTLTDTEQKKVNATVTEAIAKYSALGQQAPQKLLDLQAATKGAGEESATLGGFVNELALKYISLEAALELAKKGFEFVQGAVEGASQIQDLAEATGVSAEALQKLGYIGAGFDVDMATMGRAVETFSAKLAGNDASAVRAVQELGLNVNRLIASGPEDAFVAFSEAVGRVQDPMDKAAYYTEAFGGRLGKTLLAVGDLSKAMNDVPRRAIISDAAIKSADDFDDAIKHATIDLKAFTVEAAHAAAGGIADALKSAFSGGNSISSLLLGTFSTAAFSEMESTLKSVGIDFKEVGAGAQVAAEGVHAAAASTNEAIDRDKAYENEVNALKASHASLTETLRGRIETLHNLGDNETNIAKTLHLSEEAVSAYVKQIEEDAKAQKMLEDAVREVDQAGEDWRTTVAGLNQDMVAQIKNSLDAGVSVKALAVYWGLAESAIRDVSKSLTEEQTLAAKASKEQIDQITALTKVWSDYDDLRVQHGGTAYDQQIAQVNKWAADTTAALQKLGIDAATIQDAIGTGVSERMRGIAIDFQAITNDLSTNTQRGLQQIADKAKNTFEEALKHTGELSDATLQKYRDAWDQAQLAADTWGMATIQDAQKVAEASAASADGIANNYTLAFDKVTTASHVTRAEVEKQLDAMDRAYEDAGIFVDKAATMLLRETSLKGLPKFGNGVQNFSGGLAIVGDRGPELLNLPGGSSVTPTSGIGGNYVINVTVIAQPGANAAEQGRLAADATAARLKALGVRLGA